MTARRRLALEPDDVRELLDLARVTGSKRDRGPWVASQLLAAVAKRIEEAAAGWTEAEAAELAPVIEAAADRYLCIVAARDGRASKLFLPFDDDPVLSVILSKAFMLADDTAIDDETILTQMNA